MNESRRNFILLGVAILAIVVFYYVLWTRSMSPLPTLGPGQTIQNPFGNSKPPARGGAPATGR